VILRASGKKTKTILTSHLIICPHKHRKLLSLVEDIQKGDLLKYEDKQGLPDARNLIEDIKLKKRSIEEDAMKLKEKEATREHGLAGLRVEATNDFVATTQDELSFTQGDHLIVKDAVPGSIWWLARDGVCN